MIYLSTGGFRDKTFAEVADLFDANKVKAFELSSGRYTENLMSDLSSVSERFSIALHNYFPVPKDPFVFNLASKNEDIKLLSLAHAKKAIDLSAQFGCPYYSFHAGYLLDPQVGDLGRRLNSKVVIDRDEGLANFIKNVNYLAGYAESRKVKLLIENNVLSLENHNSFDVNPLLMVEGAETELIFSQVSSNVALLIDVAHLKVSAHSLDFDGIEYIERFSGITEAYHLSDNDGTADTNNRFDENAWFFPHIKNDVSYYSIEVYNEGVKSLESQYELVENWILKKNEK